MTLGNTGAHPGKAFGSILVNFTTAQSFELVKFELWDPPYELVKFELWDPPYHTKQEGRE